MRALSVVRKTILELWREPMLLGLLLLFPAAFIGLYYIAFGRTEAGLSTYLSILVVNEDAGAAMPEESPFVTAQGERWQAGEELIGLIEQTEWEGEPVFEVEIVTDRRAAEIALKERKASLLLAIPPDFTQALIESSAGLPGASPAVVSLVGDPGSDSFVFARGLLSGLVRESARQFAGWQASSPAIRYEYVRGTGTMSDFDFGVIGIIVFGITCMVLTTATVLVRENVSGTLQRLRLTRLSAGDLLLGVTLAQMVAAAVQVVLTFGAAVAMGFQSNGSLLLAMGIVLLLNLSMVGVGLIVACFARNDGEATNLASAALVPLAFLSGAIFPMPNLPLLTVAGRTIQAYDILPTSHAAEAMRRVLVYGDGPGAVAYELVAMAVLSLLLFAVGVVMYQRMRLRKV